MKPIGDPRAADVILSVCPPDNALEVARSVAGFTGLYVDANAISPMTSREVAAALPEATFVDGGIIGPPPRSAGTTRLYLSGAEAATVAALFADTIIDARIVADASAMKMVYASWNEGQPGVAARRACDGAGARGRGRTARRVAGPGPEPGGRRARAAKGWRWVGEMEQIADTFAAAGQPDGFHRAAADVFRQS